MSLSGNSTPTSPLKTPADVNTQAQSPFWEKQPKKQAISPLHSTTRVSLQCPEAAPMGTRCTETKARGTQSAESDDSQNRGKWTNLAIYPKLTHIHHFLATWETPPASATNLAHVKWRPLLHSSSRSDGTGTASHFPQKEDGAGGRCVVGTCPNTAWRCCTVWLL